MDIKNTIFGVGLAASLVPMGLFGQVAAPSANGTQEAAAPKSYPFTVVAVKGEVTVKQKNPDTGLYEEVPAREGQRIQGVALAPDQPVPGLIGQSEFEHLMVLKSEGGAEISNDQGKMGAAIEGQIYPIDSTIKTGHKGQIEMEFAAKNSVTIKRYSEVKTVRNPEYARLLTFSLERGSLSFRLDAFPKSHQFRVDGRLASYVAEGTAGSIGRTMSGKGVIQESLSVDSGQVGVRGEFVRSLQGVAAGQGMDISYDMEQQLLTVTFKGQVGNDGRVNILGHEFRMRVRPPADGDPILPVVVGLRLNLPVLPDFPNPIIPTYKNVIPTLPPEPPQSGAGA